MRRSGLVAAATVALVLVGLLLGVHADNLHNGLLALALAAVGEAVLQRRPGQREAQLLLASGAAEAVLFLGRQVGAHPDPPGPAWVAEWVAWCGVWPLPLVLVLVGAAFMCFPDGRFASAAWRTVFRVMLAAAAVLTAVSALWPVDYDRAGLVAGHPLRLPGAEGAAAFFDVAQPVCFTGFQLVWLACVVARYRHASPQEARQLRWLVGAVALSVVVLVAGLVATGSPRAGLLTLPLIPVAAGIAIVEASYEALLHELRAATQRVVTAQDDARRRLERDLHDGAQHRLVVLGMELGRVVERARGTADPQLADAASRARDELLLATAELRDLARGLHPAVLTQDGLVPALEALVDAAGVPTRLTVDVPTPSPAEVEATAYFVVAEALTNATRHSAASLVTVAVGRTPGVLTLVISDDGRGGAAPQGGLVGLADRVTALGGLLRVVSPLGGGTRLEVELPCP